jgi:hypothetical protein
MTRTPGRRFFAAAATCGLSLVAALSGECSRCRWEISGKRERIEKGKDERAMFAIKQELNESQRNPLRSLMVTACCAAAFFLACKGATQSAPPNAGAGSASNAAASAEVQLQPYTTPDQSAQAGVPAGWNVTTGSQTVIEMTGPQGETVTLGRTFVARNAAFQAGQKGAGGADLSMPYGANLEQKFVMIWEQGAALAGQQAQAVTFNSAAPIQMPAALGQCGRFLASTTLPSGQIKLMGAFCSLPLDSGGTYKNILVMAQAPANLAAQEAPMAQAVFSSYRVPAAMLQKKVAPFSLPPMPAGGAVGSILPGIQASNTFATCFDESVIRQYGPNQLPQECGGRAPNP